MMINVGIQAIFGFETRPPLANLGQGLNINERLWLEEKFGVTWKHSRYLVAFLYRHFIFF